MDATRVFRNNGMAGRQTAGECEQCRSKYTAVIPTQARSATPHKLLPGFMVKMLPGMNLYRKNVLRFTLFLFGCLAAFYSALPDASIATGQGTSTIQYAGWTSIASGSHCWSTDVNVTADCACLDIWQSLSCTLTKENVADPETQWRLRFNGYSTILAWLGNAAGFEDTIPADPFDLDKNNGFPSCPNLVTMNPVNFGVGNKYKQQTDFIDAALSQVTFERHYNSLYAGIPMALGPRWTHTYGSFIDEAAGESGPMATAYRADGNIYRFAQGADGWSSTAEVDDGLERLVDAQGLHAGWRYKTSEDMVETYGVDGRLQAIADLSGVVQTLTYDATGSMLQRVDISTGVFLDFRYDEYGRIESITDHTDRSWLYRYSAGHLLEFVDNPDGTSRQYHYEDPGYPEALTGITDERGIRFATYGYDTDGQANLSTLADNVERVDISYDPDGQRTVTDSRGNVSIYTVESRLGMALPAQITGPECAGCGPVNISYQYDMANNVAEKNSNGVTVEYGNYDDRGNAGYMVEASGTTEERRTDYTYDSRFFSKIATQTSASVRAGFNKITAYGYDGSGNRSSETIAGYAANGQGGWNSLARTTTWKYGGPGPTDCPETEVPFHQLCEIDGPRTDVSDITTFRYYPFDHNAQTHGPDDGRLKEVEDANGNLIRHDIHYTATGKVLSEADANNLVTDYEYYPGNDRLRRIGVTDGYSTQYTEWTYLPTGEVSGITVAGLTPDATTLSFEYDNARRLTRITDGLGNYVVYTLDTEGNRTGETVHDIAGALGRAMSWTFDVYNRMDISRSGADPYSPLEQVDSDFASNGSLLGQTDGNGVATEYSYDNLKRLLSSTRDPGGLGAVTQYLYNAAGNLAAVTDPVDGNTSYIYDDLGNLLSSSSPDTGTTHYTYDAAGNVSTRQDARGQLFTYSYDALNRLAGMDAPGTADDILYGYDSCTNGIGRLCSVTQGNTTVSYIYDAFGNVTGHQQLGYTYDAASRVKTVGYPSGALVTYSYDAAGQVNQVDLTANGITTTLAGGISYAPFGPVTGLVFGNGAVLTHSLDTSYRLTSQFVPGVLELGYTLYDGNGNLGALTDMFSGSSDFTYDMLNRLDIGNGPFGARDYDYDLNGNRTQLISDGQSTRYGYTPRSNRLETENGWTYMLDANGNTTHKLAGDGLGLVYTYNSHNRLITATERKTTGTIGRGKNKTTVTGDITLASYAYNGLGQRMSKTLADGTVKQFLYGLDGALLVEQDGDGVVAREYVYMNGQLLAVLDQTRSESGSEEVIVDNDVAPAGWTSETSNKDFGNDYLYSAGGSGNAVRWTPSLAAGTYDVYAWYVRNRKNSRQVPYAISHDGQLETVLVDQSSGGGKWQLIAQDITFDGSGAEYIEVTDMSGRTTADAVKLVKVAGGTDAPTTTVSYVHNDRLGTPQVMTDAAGNVVWIATYDPFGSAAIDPASTQTLNIRFPGQYYDEETGLHYNYYRYSDPQNGRYITADPRGQLLDYSDPVRQVAAETGIDIPQRNNFGYLNHSYGYVDSNPVNRIDPTGEIDPVTAGVIIWGLLYINHAGDAIGQPNGNLVEYLSGQDESCSLGPLGPVADSCPNILNRCIRHDDCYELNECNATSWVSTLLGGSKSCNQCNTGFFSPLNN